MFNSINDIDAIVCMPDSMAVLKYNKEERRMISYSHPFFPYSNLNIIYDFMKNERVLKLKKTSQGERSKENFEEFYNTQADTPDVFIRKEILDEDGAICFARPLKDTALIRVYIPYRREDNPDDGGTYQMNVQRYIISRVASPDIFFYSILGLSPDDPAVSSILLRIEIMRDI